VVVLVADGEDSKKWTYFGAIFGNHSHGRSTDVASTHAADLEVPFVAHLVYYIFGSSEKIKNEEEIRECGVQWVST
jgi:hypothetical protein